MERFLQHLVVEKKLAASSHREALSALLFLYREVLGLNFPWMSQIGRPAAKPRVPTVLALQSSSVVSPLDTLHALP